MWIAKKNSNFLLQSQKPFHMNLSEPNRVHEYVDQHWIEWNGVVARGMISTV